MRTAIAFRRRANEQVERASPIQDRLRAQQTENVKESSMAVQQNKKSPSKRGMHRSHDHLSKPPVAVEPTTGETHLRHHISPSGYYRGKKVIQTKD